MSGGQVVLPGASPTLRADACAPLREAAEAGLIDLWAYGRGPYPGTHLDPEVLPQLRSVGCAESRSGPNWTLERDHTDGIEFTCVTGGTVQFTCTGDQRELGSRSVTITRPWQPHRVGRPRSGPAKLCWFVIDVAADRPNQEWQWPSWLPIPVPDLERLTELLR